MRTSKIEKLELELAAEEKKLKEHLLRVLPEAAESGADVFTSSEYNPSQLPTHLFRSDAETLLDSARKCVSLREAAGLGSERSVAAIFLTACQEHASSDPQRRGPRKLAASVLLALSNDT